jgi:hypothetical protein
MKLFYRASINFPPGRARCIPTVHSFRVTALLNSLPPLDHDPFSISREKKHLWEKDQRGASSHHPSLPAAIHRFSQCPPSIICKERTRHGILHARLTSIITIDVSRRVD